MNTIPVRPLSLVMILFAGILAACAAKREGDPVDDVRIEGELARELDQFLASEAESGWAGCALVARQTGLLFHKGYGVLEQKGGKTEPVTTRTPFWIASISKQFAAVALLQLAETGELSLSDSLPRFFADVPPEKRGIKVAQLLDHTAGLGRNYAADGILDRNQAVRAILALPLVHPPGLEFAYSNDAYNLVAAIVEIVSKTPYERYLTEHVLVPAGMRYTGFWGPREHPEVAVIRGAGADTTTMRPNWGFRGGTGMFSTAGDLYRWNQALMGGRVISRESVAMLLEPRVRTKKGVGVAYGWFTSRTSSGIRKVWTRGHEDFGHGAVLAVYPEEDAVIVVTSNAGERDGFPVSHRLSEALEERLFAKKGN